MRLSSTTVFTVGVDVVPTDVVDRVRARSPRFGLAARPDHRGRLSVSHAGARLTEHARAVDVSIVTSGHTPAPHIEPIRLSRRVHLALFPKLPVVSVDGDPLDDGHRRADPASAPQKGREGPHRKGRDMIA
jgi:hypothetical protein